MIPGFAHETGEMTIEITEETKFDSPKNLDVSYAGVNNLTLYPNIPVELQCGFDETGIVIPENANMFGNDTKNLKNIFGNDTILLCLTGIF